MINRIRARDKETFDRIIERFKNRSRLVDSMKGFQGIELLVNEEKLEILVVTRWDSKEDLERWLDSLEFQTVHGSGGSSLNAESEGVVYRIISV